MNVQRKYDQLSSWSDHPSYEQIGIFCVPQANSGHNTTLITVVLNSNINASFIWIIICENMIKFLQQPYKIQRICLLYEHTSGKEQIKHIS